MNTIFQEKAIQSGEIRRWVVDVATIKETIPWTKKNNSLFEREITEMDQSFPYFYITIANQSDMSHKKLFCPNCGGLITFMEGLRCVNCQTTFTPYHDSLLGYVGTIPSLIGTLSKEGVLGGKRTKVVNGRPFLKNIHQKLQGLSGLPATQIRKYFLTMKAKDQTIKVYFSPTVYAYFPSNWPQKAPYILVPRQYFKMLFGDHSYNESDFHAYSNGYGDMLQLCNYGNWHTVTMRTVLQQRIVPKIIIDLMIADLIGLGKLNSVTNRLGTNVHNLYNWIGKHGRSQQFQDMYNRYVHSE